jgi:hypothetical protein
MCEYLWDGFVFLCWVDSEQSKLVTICSFSSIKISNSSLGKKSIIRARLHRYSALRHNGHHEQVGSLGLRLSVAARQLLCHPFPTGIAVSSQVCHWPCLPNKLCIQASSQLIWRSCFRLLWAYYPVLWCWQLACILLSISFFICRCFMLLLVIHFKCRLLLDWHGYLIGKDGLTIKCRLWVPICCSGRPSLFQVGQSAHCISQTFVPAVQLEIASYILHGRYTRWHRVWIDGSSW